MMVEEKSNEFLSNVKKNHEDFNALIDKIKENQQDIPLTKDMADSMTESQLVKLCFYLKDNTKIKNIFSLDDENHSNENDSDEIKIRKICLSLIKNILDRNICRYSLELNYEKLKEAFLIKHIAANFESFFLMPIAYGLNIGKYILYYPLNFINKFLLKKDLRKIKRIALPTFIIKKSHGKLIARVDRQKFLINSFNRFFIPFLYLARNTGKLLGVLIALPVSFLLNPIGLIKSFYDASQEKKEIHIKIKEKKPILLAQEKEINAAYKNIKNIKNIFYITNFEKCLNLNIKMSIKDPEDIRKIFLQFDKVCSTFSTFKSNKELKLFVLGAIAFFQSIKKDPRIKKDFVYAEAQLALYKILENYTQDEINAQFHLKEFMYHRNIGDPKVSKKKPNRQPYSLKVVHENFLNNKKNFDQKEDSPLPSIRSVSI